MIQTSVSETIRKPPIVKAQTALKTIHQVAAPCSVIRGSGMTCHMTTGRTTYGRRKASHIWSLRGLAITIVMQSKNEHEMCLDTKKR